MTKLELAYMAGIFDGEGCLTLKRLTTMKHGRKSPVYFPEVRIRMCDPRALQLFVKHLPMRMRYEKTGNAAVKRARPIYTVYCACRKAQTVIKLLRPFSIIKREEIDAVLDYFKKAVDPYHKLTHGYNRRPLPRHFLKLRHKFYLKLRALKRRRYRNPLRRNPYGQTAW